MPSTTIIKAENGLHLLNIQQKITYFQGNIYTPPTTTGGGGSGTSDHGALSGLNDDDHPQYALADGTRGSFEAAGAVATLQASLGTASTEDVEAFATAAQGVLAGTALQPGANVSALVNDAGYLVLSDISGKANSATTFTAGTGLDGGGDLSDNRTFNLDAATQASLALANTALQSDDIASFETSTQLNARDTANRDPDNFDVATDIRSFLNTSSDANARKELGVEIRRYVALDPVAQEFSDVAVSTTGQLYTLASVPSDRFCLVQLLIDPGLPVSSGDLSVVVEGSALSNRTTPGSPIGAGYSGVAPNYGMFFNGSVATGSAGTIWVPTTTGQVWMRRQGTYFSATLQTSVWVLGYFEGDA